MQLARITVTDKTICLNGGNPGGRDDVHKIVTDWPGWRRAPGFALLDGVRVSSFYAARTPSAILAPVGCTTLQIVWSDEALELSRHWTRKLALVKDALASDHQFLPRVPFPTERRPMPHQAAALRAIEALDYRMLLADDMGLGKTATALWAAHAAGAKRLLIICPVSVKYNWQREISETLGDEWGVTVLEGSAKRRADSMAEAMQVIHSEPAPKHALILNYDLLASLIDKDDLGHFALHAFHIYDESHYIKSLTAERTKIVQLQLAPLADHILMLSGTPICNFVSDIFPQAETLRPGTWVSYHDFCKRHLDMRLHDNGVRKVMIPARSKRIGALNAIINTFQVRRLKEECLNLPSKMRTYPELSMDTAMRSVYNAMKDFARIELEALIEQHGTDQNIWHPAVRTGARNVMMRCEQIAAGFLGGISTELESTVDDAKFLEALGPTIHKQAEKIPGRPGELIFPGFAKIVWLIEAIEAVLTQGGHPVIFSRFNGPLFWLQPRFKKSAILHGGLSGEQKHAAISDFQDGKLDVLFCQVRMAQGFNLTRARDVLFYGRDWAPAVNAQAEDRCHRIGQAGTVQIQIPIVRKTIEVYLDRKLRMKETDASNALAKTTLGELLSAL